VVFDLESMKRDVAGLNDAGLLDIVTVQREEYCSETVEFALEELRRRGVEEVTEEHFELRRAAAAEEGGGVRRGLGGWLIVVGINLVIYALSYGYWAVDLAFSLMDSLRAGDADSAELLLFGLLFSSCLALSLGSLWLLWPYFRRSWTFPRLYLAFLILDLLLDLIAYGVTLASDLGVDAEGDLVVSVLRSLVFFVFWASYLRSSERVRLTFVRGSPSREGPPPAPCPTAAGRSGP